MINVKFWRPSDTAATLRQHHVRNTNFNNIKSTSIFQLLHFYKLQYTITEIRGFVYFMDSFLFQRGCRIRVQPKF